MKFYNECLSSLGFSGFTEIQAKTIAEFDNYQEFILYSPTGSGKTLAFILPILKKMNENSGFKGVQTLILAPTRELALQIESTFKSLKSEFLVTCCYGGHSIKTEVQNLKANPQVVIGTPGRIDDHIKRGNLILTDVQYLVIDEFDKSLEIGFLTEIEFIYSRIKQYKKLILSSATKIQEYPSFLSLKKSCVVDVLDKVEAPEIHFYEICNDENRVKIVQRMLHEFRYEPTILFVNFREEVDALATYLLDEGFAVVGYHGGLEQDERERALIKFRNGSCPTLICTDLGARGLDIPKVKHIVHYQLPEKEDAFIHRNGRTARMSEDGSVYLFKGDESNYELPNCDQITFKGDFSPLEPEWTTIYVSAGKKDKINKVDIVGFFCQKGNLVKDQLGLIAVLDKSSFVAVKSSKVRSLLFELRKHKIKGKTVRISIAR